MKTKHLPISLTFILFGLFAWMGSAASQNVTTVSGRVTDAEGTPLSGVTIEVEKADLSTNTRKDGSYKIIIANLTEARLKFTLKDYEPVTKSVKLIDKQMQLDMQLKSTVVKIQMTTFRSRAYIRGKVTGMPKENFAMYKLVAYVLTDQWYIHPWADNAPGRGFALIDTLGNWELQTVWREFQASQLAFILVPLKQYVPPTVPLADRYAPPETPLLTALKCGDRYLIIEAPQGI